MQSLPRPILDAMHEPYGARAVIYTLRIDSDAEPRRMQFEQLAQHADRGVFDQTMKLLRIRSHLEKRTLLPLIYMAISALLRMLPAQTEAFTRNVDALISVDKKIDLFE